MSKPRVDWHKVFEDIAYLGQTGDALAERIGIRLGLLVKISEGKERPSVGAADRIANLWCHLTGKPVEFIHSTTEPIGTARRTIENLESNAEQAPVYQQVEMIVMGWARRG